jgi:hypothetical protein
VDDSAEIERMLSSSRPAVPVPGLASPNSSSSSSRPATPLSPRPKLSDTLNQVMFSPKRPRSGQAHPVTRVVAPQSKSQGGLARHAPQVPRKTSAVARASIVAVVDDDEIPLSKSPSSPHNPYKHIYQQSLSYAIPPEPEKDVPVLSHQENPSKFTRMARGLAKEILDEQHRQHRDDDRPAFAQSTLREKKNTTKTDNNKVPLRSVLSELHDPPVQAYMVPVKTGLTPLKSKVYLPDVTGLTHVVASPAKFGAEYLGYELQDDELDGE